MPIYFRYPPGVLVFFNEGPIKARLRRDTAACVCVLVLHPWFPVFRAFRGLVPHPHVGSGGTQNLARRVGSGRVGSGQEDLEYHGSGQVALTQPYRREVIRPMTTKALAVFSEGPGRCLKYHGSGWVGPDRVGSGRVGSDRVGSGRV